MHHSAPETLENLKIGASNSSQFSINSLYKQLEFFVQFQICGRQGVRFHIGQIISQYQVHHAQVAVVGEKAFNVTNVASSTVVYWIDSKT